ncbi:hypothetical protein VNO80_17684 [Phaseolus coccineus]|uniref:Uncharacterized protein n=1 Tax=Phaseolus coccineus TaxID=3886 RepID=A0AAN9QVS2_PHACN
MKYLKMFVEYIFVWFLTQMKDYSSHHSSLRKYAEYLPSLESIFSPSWLLVGRIFSPSWLLVGRIPVKNTSILSKYVVC